jgi:hypothetical protein
MTKSLRLTAKPNVISYYYWAKIWFEMALRSSLESDRLSRLKEVCPSPPPSPPLPPLPFSLPSLSPNVISYYYWTKIWLEMALRSSLESDRLYRLKEVCLLSCLASLASLASLLPPSPLCSSLASLFSSIPFLLTYKGKNKINERGIGIPKFFGRHGTFDKNFVVGGPHLY